MTHEHTCCNAMCVELLLHIAGCKDTPKLDWTATPEALSKAKKRCEDMRIYDDVVCLPPGIRTVEFEKALGAAGRFKTWEYLLMAGPYGKYLLEDCFHPEVQAVVFECLDLLGLVWLKTISSELLTRLESRMPVVLTLLETLLPSWELDLNRHKMIHLVRAIRKKPDLCQQARRLCSGPLKSAQVFDRATIQGIRFSTTKTVSKKKARESVVLMSDNNKSESASSRVTCRQGSVFHKTAMSTLNMCIVTTIFLRPCHLLWVALSSRRATRMTPVATCGLLRSLLLASLLLSTTRPARIM